MAMATGLRSRSVRNAQSRRLRRRPLISSAYFCSTNGCPTRLVENDAGDKLVCPICGLTRRLPTAPTGH